MSKVTVSVTIEVDGQPVTAPVTTSATCTGADVRPTMAELCRAVAEGLIRTAREIETAGAVVEEYHA